MRRFFPCVIPVLVACSSGSSDDSSGNDPSTPMQADEDAEVASGTGMGSSSTGAGSEADDATSTATVGTSAAMEVSATQTAAGSDPEEGSANESTANEAGTSSADDDASESGMAEGNQTIETFGGASAEDEDENASGRTAGNGGGATNTQSKGGAGGATAEPASEVECPLDPSGVARTCTTDADCGIAEVIVSCGSWLAGVHQDYVQCAPNWISITDVECFDSQVGTDDGREVPTQEPDNEVTVSCVDGNCRTATSHVACGDDVCLPGALCIDALGTQMSERLCVGSNCVEPSCECAQADCAAAGYPVCSLTTLVNGSYVTCSAEP